MNTGGTPTTALLLSTGVGFLFLLSGTFGAVIATLSVFTVLNYLVCFLALFRLRGTEPERPRPYRAWGYPWATALAVVISIIFLVGVVWSDPVHALVALGALALSVPAFWLLRRFVHPATRA